MNRHYTTLGVVMALILTVSLAAISASYQKLQAIGSQSTGAGARKALTSAVDTTPDAPLATSGNNVYVSWWSNKTGNDEVMFKASTDGGETFGDKMNLSNTTNSQSQDASIAAAGSNVYVSWWERNATSNEPVLRVSHDNGKTFGEKIMLSEK
jgi:hypothetical protein